MLAHFVLFLKEESHFRLFPFERISFAMNAFRFHSQFLLRIIFYALISVIGLAKNAKQLKLCFEIYIILFYLNTSRYLSYIIIR